MVKLRGFNTHPEVPKSEAKDENSVAGGHCDMLVSIDGEADWVGGHGSAGLKIP